MSSIDDAIIAARAVAATPGARELRERSRGTAGTWTEQDERDLRAGFLCIWNPHRRAYEKLLVPVRLESRT